MRGYQLRGTSGSGKTTVARAVLRASQAVPIAPTQGRIRKYVGVLEGEPLIVLGDYTPVNGGCDTIQSVHIVAELIEEVFTEYADENGWLFYEGLMISHMLGTVGQAQAMTGLERHYLAFLDTPLPTCLERVQKRRDARGVTKPFNPANTTKDWDAVRLSRKNALLKGYNVLDIPHNDAIRTVLGHLRGDLELSTFG